MEDAKLSYISVVITAYNREEFLLNAIKSVLNQTLDKKYYEVIVIKNYNDDIIDNFINVNNIKNIVMDGTIGEFLYAGVSIASGEVISFLDDDDLFTHNKLEVILNKFKSSNTVYYHNDHITINEKYQKFDSNLGKSIIFNLSSISVKKTIVNLNHLKKINSNTDHFMYLLALESNQKIIAGKEKLTYYMFHTSTSHVDTNDIELFIKHRNVNLEQDIKSFIMFDEMFISRKAKNYIKQKITNLEIDGYILGDNKKPRNSLNIFKQSDRSIYIVLKIYLAYLLVRVHYNFRYIIIKKLLNNNKKS
ncbi:glycosyltransferase family 2 protein [Ferroplasma sp.]|uniref:glycosyltransferase family 2 protein n=1 Tax=Ferroplasma sp. TaxID=2591003 RepID=UPI0026141A12|nr:glycosyltransferase family 2 protein [Ferroplasma sp.]